MSSCISFHRRDDLQSVPLQAFFQSFPSANSGIVYVPDSHPTPSASLPGFGVFLWFFLVGLVWCRLRGVARLARFVACMRKACITIHGGRWPRQPPPPLGIIIIMVFKIPRFLGVGRSPVQRPWMQCCTDPSTLPHSPPAAVKTTARMKRVGGQPYCHTNAVDVGRPNASCLFGALCARIF